MHRVAHVQLVDAHGELPRRDHDAGLLVEKIVLIGAALFVVHPRVAARHGIARFLELRADLFDELLRAAVDDAALLRMGRNIVRDPRVLVCGLLDVEVEVRAVITPGQAQRPVQAEEIDDIVLDLSGCQSGERAHRRTLGQRLAERRDVLIARPIIIPPLGHAVRLLHSDERNLNALRKRKKFLIRQALRFDIENLEYARLHAAQRLRILLGAQGVFEKRHRDAHPTQRRDLFSDLRARRRDDQRQPRQHQRGELIAEGLSRSDWHRAHHILTVQQRVNQLLLPGAEGIVPKNLIEQRHLFHK